MISSLLLSSNEDWRELACNANDKSEKISRKSKNKENLRSGPSCFNKLEPNGMSNIKTMCCKVSVARGGHSLHSIFSSKTSVIRSVDLRVDFFFTKLESMPISSYQKNMILMNETMFLYLSCDGKWILHTLLNLTSNLKKLKIKILKTTLCAYVIGFNKEKQRDKTQYFFTTM